jgi:hypothetical protein
VIFVNRLKSLQQSFTYLGYVKLLRTSFAFPYCLRNDKVYDSVLLLRGYKLSAYVNTACTLYDVRTTCDSTITSFSEFVYSMLVIQSLL